MMEEEELKKMLLKRKLNLYPNKELYDSLEEGALQMDRSLNKFCLMILENFKKNTLDKINYEEENKEQDVQEMKRFSEEDYNKEMSQAT